MVEDANGKCFDTENILAMIDVVDIPSHFAFVSEVSLLCCGFKLRRCQYNMIGSEYIQSFMLKRLLGIPKLLKRVPSYILQVLVYTMVWDLMLSSMSIRDSNKLEELWSYKAEKIRFHSKKNLEVWMMVVASSYLE